MQWDTLDIWRHSDLGSKHRYPLGVLLQLSEVSIVQADLLCFSDVVRFSEDYCLPGTDIVQSLPASQL